MKPKVKFVLLSLLIGTSLYFVLSLLLSAIILAISGEGPHGYGVFIYLVLPLYLMPVGFLTSLITSLMVKELIYKKIFIWLAVVFVAVVGGTGLLLAIYRAFYLN